MLRLGTLGTKEPINQPINHSTKITHSLAHSLTHSLTQSINQINNQTNKQPTNQPISQSINQRISQIIKLHHLTLKVLLSVGKASILGASLVDSICKMWMPPCTADPSKGRHSVLANSARWKAPASARMQGVPPRSSMVELTMPLTSVCDARHLPAKHASHQCAYCAVRQARQAG